MTKLVDTVYYIINTIYEFCVLLIPKLINTKCIMYGVCGLTMFINFITHIVKVGMYWQ